MTIGKVQITTQILKLGALADQNHLFLGFLSQSDVFERDFYPINFTFWKVQNRIYLDTKFGNNFEIRVF